MFLENNVHSCSPLRHTYSQLFETIFIKDKIIILRSNMYFADKASGRQQITCFNSTNLNYKNTWQEWGNQQPVDSLTATSLLIQELLKNREPWTLPPPKNIINMRPTRESVCIVTVVVSIKKIDKVKYGCCGW